MSKKQDTTWPAPAHTLAKIEILESYLYLWFQILGRSKVGQDLLYIDGFAGPGKYTNSSKGSPVAAVIAAMKAKADVGKRWLAGTIHFAFFEKNKKRFASLEGIVVPLKRTGVCVYAVNMAFTGGLEFFREVAPQFFNRSLPLFVFIDPFGAKGYPFDSIRDILSSKCSEVLINLDADGIARITRAKGRANFEILDTVFGGREIWWNRLSTKTTFSSLCKAILDLYTEQLRSIPNVEYVYHFGMQSSKSSLTNYYLVFASQSPLGLKKMKEAMLKISKDGTYSFCGPNDGQTQLFRGDDPEECATQMHRRYAGNKVLYSEVEKYALNHSPFLNPKLMLRTLENHNKIEVISKNAKRKKGTYVEKDTEYIIFLL